MNIYNTVPAAKLKRSMFHWRKERNQSQDFGAIVPIFWKEVLPNDVWKMNESVFIRVQPMVAAPFTPMRYYSEFWFFPTRVLMQKIYPEIVDAWETFIFGGPNGDGKNEAGQTPTLPLWIPNKSGVRLAGTNVSGGVQSHKTGNADAKGSLWDYFGLPVNQGYHNLTDNGSIGGVNYKPFIPLGFARAAYNFLWNEYKRNENLEAPVPLDSDDIQFCKWKHDRFTSALPFQQRGQAVALPLGEVAFSSSPMSVKPNQLYAFNTSDYLDAPLSGIAKDVDPLIVSKSGQSVINIENEKIIGAENQGIGIGWPTAGTADSVVHTNSAYSWAKGFGINNSNSNLSSQINVTVDGVYGPVRSRYPAYTQANVDVSDLRLMFQTQKFMERAARGGVRYIEGLKAFFGSNIKSSVLQLPQFIGGMKQNIIVNEVLQTSETNDTPQGNIAGRGVSAGAENIGTFTTAEHGYILGICWIKPDLYYNSQGVNKEWLRRSKFDFYWPQFAHLSEQPIQKCELFADLSLSPAQLGAGIEGTFGYTGIYNEYRSVENEICGEMRDTFDYWHLARKFSSAPELNSDFITCFPRKDIFAAQDEDEFLLDILIDCKVYRSIPIESNPGLLDHF